MIVHLVSTILHILCHAYSEEEEEEEHNWIFSADQMETEGTVLICYRGASWNFILWYHVTTSSFFTLSIVEGDDSEWNDSLIPTSTIGVSNGDHDLAHTVLQVMFVYTLMLEAAQMWIPIWVLFFMLLTYLKNVRIENFCSQRDVVKLLIILTRNCKDEILFDAFRV